MTLVYDLGPLLALLLLPLPLGLPRQPGSPQACDPDRPTDSGTTDPATGITQRDRLHQLNLSIGVS
jgi:hypothetical protein